MISVSAFALSGWMRPFLSRAGVALLVQQGLLHGHLPIAELAVRENPADLAFLKRHEDAHDLLTLRRGKLAVLFAHVLAQGRLDGGRVDELNLALAALFLAVGQHPDERANARVVEHLFRQRDDGLHQVVLDHIAAGVALAAACIARKQAGTVPRQCGCPAAYPASSC